MWMCVQNLDKSRLKHMIIDDRLGTGDREECEWRESEWEHEERATDLVNWTKKSFFRLHISGTAQQHYSCELIQNYTPIKWNYNACEPPIYANYFISAQHSTLETHKRVLSFRFQPKYLFLMVSVHRKRWITFI